MSDRSPQSAVVDFLNEWEEGGTPQLRDYLPSESSDQGELMESVVDCVLFGALTRPFQLWAIPGRS